MRWILIVHRWFGLAAAIFLAIAALTGCFLVFGNDDERMAHPLLWRVHSEGPRMREQDLLQAVERDAKTASVDSMEFPGERAPQIFTRSDGVRVYVNPYDGTILRKTRGSSASGTFIGTMLQIHVRLLAGAAGEWIVNIATAVLLLIVPTGLLLWWRKPRFAFRTSRSFKRTVYDFHNVLGFYGAILILVLASTGALLAFERPLSAIVGIKDWQMPAAPHSTMRSTPAMEIDALLTRARNAVPDAAITRVTLPRRRISAVRIEMRGPGAFDQNTVYLDRYSGAVLRVDDLRQRPLGYRLRAVPLALHTGNLYGLTGKALAFLASVSLALLVITGTMMWYARRS